MIIQCTSCNKKFEVNVSLIPPEGRDLQCGSCNHTWFYLPDNKLFAQEIKTISKLKVLILKIFYLKNKIKMK